MLTQVRHLNFKRTRTYNARDWTVYAGQQIIVLLQSERREPARQYRLLVFSCVLASWKRINQKQVLRYGE